MCEDFTNKLNFIGFLIAQETRKIDILKLHTKRRIEKHNHQNLLYTNFFWKKEKKNVQAESLQKGAVDWSREKRESLDGGGYVWLQGLLLQSAALAAAAATTVAGNCGYGNFPAPLFSHFLALQTFSVLAPPSCRGRRRGRPWPIEKLRQLKTNLLWSPSSFLLELTSCSNAPTPHSILLTTKFLPLQNLSCHCKSPIFKIFNSNFFLMGYGNNIIIFFSTLQRKRHYKSLNATLPVFCFDTTCQITWKLTFFIRYLSYFNNRQLVYEMTKP